ncbi:MAG TPA: EamA family transporter, partial [Thermoanaerobaculia bacterium]|nr:EamA family transporter [Thermoanaerobaculia bacterium]
MKHERAVAYAAFATVCIVWGTTYLFIRIAVETIPPLLLTAARYLGAGLILLLIAALRGDRFPRDRRTLGEIVLVGVLLVGVGNLSVVWAEQWVPSGIAALFVATAPFWATVMEGLRAGGERVQRRRLGGMLLGFAGVALLVTPGGAGGAFDHHFVIGALVIQLGCVGWQYGTSRGKYNLASVPPLMSSALQAFAGGAIVGITGLAVGELPRFHVTPRTLVALLYLMIFGSVIAFTAYVYAMRSLQMTTLSLYSYVNPVVAVILGWIVLNERLTWVSVTAMVTILAGVALVQGGS